MADQVGAAERTADRPRLGVVFYASTALAVVFIVLGLLFSDRLAAVLESIRLLVVNTVGPVYPITVFALLLFVTLLAVSPFGRRRLGAETDRPRFGWLSYVAMLISAGVGMSFLFWGTAEPLIHLTDPPYGIAEPGSAEAAMTGMRYSLLFWGLHAWALYAVVAVAVGYSSFRHGRPVLISAALHPLLGKRAYGPIGKIVDILAVFAILFGVATSLGLGSRELNAGLGYSFGLPESYGIKIAIIAGLMTISTISAATGLGRGIRWLSLANGGLCLLLLIFVFVAGPTIALISTFGRSVGGYAGHFLQMSFATESTPGSSWQQDWIYFFWAWWISWSPFVGSFIARISKGRTIRSVVIGTALVPSVVSAVWFSVFGGTALQRQFSGAVDVAEGAAQTKAIATFEVFGTLPLPSITAVLVVIVLALLFITSADSAAFMLGSTTSGGSMKPPKTLKLMWAFSAAFAAVLLLGGGTASLQGAAVIAAVPFTVILIALAAATVVDLVRDHHA